MKHKYNCRIPDCEHSAHLGGLCKKHLAEEDERLKHKAEIENFLRDGRVDGDYLRGGGTVDLQYAREGRSFALNATSRFSPPSSELVFMAECLYDRCHRLADTLVRKERKTRAGEDTRLLDLELLLIRHDEVSSGISHARVAEI
jgi:hypothetical protein